MSDLGIDAVLARFRVRAKIFHNGQYCGSWAVDTSGSKNMNFHLVTRGECWLLLDGQSTLLKAGDAIFFPKDAKHALRSSVEDETKVNSVQSQAMNLPHGTDSVGLVCGYFEPLTPMFRAMSDHFPELIVLRRGDSAISTALIVLMISEAKRAGLSNSVLLDRFADCLFFLLLRDHLSEEEGLFAALNHPKLEKVMSLIHAESETPISLEDMVDVAGMSRSSFSSLFKQVLGQSPKEYATQWRMTQAYEWLSEGGVTTLEAALRSGYENEASFAKAFKRVIGVGPGAVRARA